MRVRQILVAVLYLLAAGLLIVGAWPKVAGGHFDRQAVFSAVLLFIVATAARALLRRRVAGE